MVTFLTICYGIFYVLQSLVFLYELIYLLVNVGILGTALGIFIFPITWLLLPIYMYIVNGIWIPLLITWGGIIFVGILHIIAEQ